MVGPPRLALGSVQWGMSYGIANRTGQPPLDAVRHLLQLADAAGVRTIDTARSYGESESVIGELVGPDPAWTVMTKLAAELPSDQSAEELICWARHSLDQSRQALRRPRLDALLLHRAAHRTLAGGAIWQELLRQRDSGRIEVLGVSVVSPAEAEGLLDDADVGVVQVPGSLLDQRILRSGLLDRLQAAGKRVVVRSLFLQGVAHLGWEGLPSRLREPLSALREPLRLIDSWCSARSLSRPDAFLAFGHCLLGAVVLIGCENPEQLAHNLGRWRETATLRDEVRQLAGSLPDLDESLINPALWPPS